MSSDTGYWSLAVLQWCCRQHGHPGDDAANRCHRHSATNSHIYDPLDFSRLHVADLAVSLTRICLSLQETSFSAHQSESLLTSTILVTAQKTAAILRVSFHQAGTLLFQSQLCMVPVAIHGIQHGHTLYLCRACDNHQWSQGIPSTLDHHLPLRRCCSYAQQPLSFSPSHLRRRPALAKSHPVRVASAAGR